MHTVKTPTRDIRGDSTGADKLQSNLTNPQVKAETSKEGETLSVREVSSEVSKNKILKAWGDDQETDKILPVTQAPSDKAQPKSESALESYLALCERGPLLQEDFGGTPEQVQDLLRFLHPESPGFPAEFTLADAMKSLGEDQKILREIVNLLIERYGEDVELRQAASNYRAYLAEGYPPGAPEP